MNRRETIDCPKCQGIGINAENLTTCDHCKGNRRIKVSFNIHDHTCSECNGNGFRIKTLIIIPERKENSGNPYAVSEAERIGLELQKCPACYGHGKEISLEAFNSCSDCGGHGHVMERVPGLVGLFKKEPVQCEICHGAGRHRYDSGINGIKMSKDIDYRAVIAK